jgi:flagellar motor protein MotB
MRAHPLRLLTLLLCIPLFPACTAKYQDMLRDRDATIRDLNSQVAGLRATNEDLARREADARKLAESGRAAAPSDAGAAKSGEVDRLQAEIPEVEVRYRRGRISLSIENTVTFDSGSKALKSSSANVLQKVANVLKRDYRNHRIYIEGHTDTDPITRTKDQFRSNRHLSAERADAVATWLIDKGGVPARNIVVVGFGEHDPDLAGGANAKARNRRVEIVVGEVL